MFPLELPGTEFSRIEHSSNPRNSCPALQYSVLFCSSTKPETKTPLHTAVYHLHPEHPRLMLFIDRHILSYPAWTQPQNLSRQSTGNNYHLIGIGVEGEIRFGIPTLISSLINFLRVVWYLELALKGEWQDHTSVLLMEPTLWLLGGQHHWQEKGHLLPPTALLDDNSNWIISNHWWMEFRSVSSFTSFLCVQ